MARRNRQSYRVVFPVAEDATHVDMEEEDARPLLESGEITGGHRMPWGSNYTFLVWIDAGPGKYLRAIYKPRDGERPLWDFPTGTLYQRERAAFLLSRLLGWPNIPLTLLRDGPYGIGMVQHYVESDPDVTYFDIVKQNSSHEELCKIMVFRPDLQQRRPQGRALLGRDGRANLGASTTDFTFHPSFKLRTVMMEFWGREVPTDLVADLGRLHRKLDTRSEDTAELRETLRGPELKALTKRLRFMLSNPGDPQARPELQHPLAVRVGSMMRSENDKAPVGAGLKPAPTPVAPFRLDAISGTARAGVLSDCARRGAYASVHACGDPGVGEGGRSGGPAGRWREHRTRQHLPSLSQARG